MSIVELVFSDGKNTRLDQYITSHLPDYSRTSIQKMIKNHQIVVNNQIVKAGYKLQDGDIIQIEKIESAAINISLKPQLLDLDILFEDDSIIVINKSAGMIVHPGAGQSDGTLVNGLLYYCSHLSDISGVTRPGIIHRLDQYTSGVIVAAKNNRAHKNIAEQFQQRTVEKTYVGFTWGEWKNKEGSIRARIGRNRKDPTSFSVTENGRMAETLYSVKNSFRYISLIEFYPKTGRTHQIRVHAQYMGHPIIGDNKYNGGLNRVKGFLPEVQRDLKSMMSKLDRQALHAASLSFLHPDSGDKVTFSADLPNDMLFILQHLQDNYA